MTRNACKDCRWWQWYGRDDPDDPDPMPERAMCALTQSHSTRGEDHPESKAIADGNGEVMVLWTQPEFGCVQFQRIEPPLADHFYAPRDRSTDTRLAGVCIVVTCGQCGRPGSEHPQRPRQEHAYVEGTNLVPDWEAWKVLGCTTCERPIWEHPGPDPKDFI